MAYKTCNACSGTGQKTFVGGTHATTEHCNACDGTGNIRIADPIQPPPPKPPTTSGTDKTGPKPNKNTKFIKLAISTIAFIFGYWITLEHFTDTFYIAAAIGLICFFFSVPLVLLFYDSPNYNHHCFCYLGRKNIVFLLNSKSLP
ncbi:DnaJ-like cysteine-rich domain-containing protein [Cellulophaga lytica]|uniref:hypothetical protein n=1 Tax=Cellulophaga lytica TaxID=979 RepID=UPI000B6DAC5D|nr:hypothetical protein [Cellulophaga lytica]SNQ42286.1 conserved hypothetical protein [Cellulophaga lytica]